MFKNFIEKIEEVKAREFEVVRSRGALAIQQTQRNLLKNELMEAFFEGLKELGEEAGVLFYETADGLIMEVDNPAIRNRVARMRDESDSDSEGYMSVEFNFKIKNLDYDASIEAMIFENDRIAKLEKEEAKRKQKEARIQRDAEERAIKARIRERRVAEALARNEEINE